MDSVILDSMKGAAFTKFWILDSVKGAAFTKGFCEGSCLHKMDSVKGAAFTKWIL